MSDIVLQSGGLGECETDLISTEDADRAAPVSFLFWALEEAQRLDEAEARDHLTLALLELTKRQGRPSTLGTH